MNGCNTSLVVHCEGNVHRGSSSSSAIGFCLLERPDCVGTIFYWPATTSLWYFFHKTWFLFDLLRRRTSFATLCLFFLIFRTLPFSNAAETSRKWWTAKEDGSTKTHLFFCLSFTFPPPPMRPHGAKPVTGLSVDFKAHNVNPYNSGLLQTSLKSPNRMKDSWFCVERWLSSDAALST